MSDDVSVGDSVTVRLRTEPGSERVVHKFSGEVRKIDVTGLSETRVVRISLPFGVANTVSVPAYKAEFEVEDDD